MNVKISTTLGDIIVRLYDETPLHRDNFLKLAKEGYYDGTIFHRVIKNFMIQGGDPDSKNPVPGAHYGTGGPDYTIEAEIKQGLYHKRGALAAARQGDEVNPERRSSGSQFYIVWGDIYKEGQLGQLSKQLEMQAQQGIFNKLVAGHRAEILQMRKNRDQSGLMELQEKLIAETERTVKKQGTGGLSDEQKEIYTTVGGTPHLDGQYTVFGEVTEGLDVVEKIQQSATHPDDRPVDDIVMKVTVAE
ncbi:MAG: peptidylprolyl isomerase [Bacteroidales bacterium]|nr:peptidylprolyl isomerase [Bacteroidales bacterium]MCM1147819.1 peptidylprolyl isomerase [Bacteroidales bacterium]MCM1206467.1 peptidylprolyl isomerase [Bacillota bacterium]MCM1510352.1 peptidylprolyl isomerase [Clostridium sp.]